MKSISEMFRQVRSSKRPVALIASLPVNDPELARACIEGGADVVKVHINLKHRASSNMIGTLNQERESLLRILELCRDVPCGIVPAADPAAVHPDEMDEIVQMGFDFISLYLRDAPIGLLPPSIKIERMLALSSEDPLELVKSLDGLDMQVLEASIMAKETYGKPLTYRDLAQYNFLRQNTDLPVVVPSQHKIPPAAISDLAEIGIEGLMLGTIVCGDTPLSWKETFQAFKKESERVFKEMH